jgi:hypothetical protein
MSGGDWEAVWPLFGLELESKTKAHFDAVNDPKALAAERMGRLHI